MNERKNQGMYDLIISRRTVRQFSPRSIPEELLEKMVNAARLAPSAANLQPLEFVAVSNETVRKKIFPNLRWAAYIAPEGDPKPGREPRAYIVTLVNDGIKQKGFEWDAGAAIENMIMTAWSDGVASCWLLSVDREEVREILNIPSSFNIDSVLALGYPAEEPMAEDMGDSIKYYRDKHGRLHVPKRPLRQVMHKNTYG